MNTNADQLQINGEKKEGHYMNKKTKQRFGAAAMALTMAATLVGCGGAAAPGSDVETSTSDKDGKPGEKTIVEFWTGDRHDQEYVSAMIKKFNETNTDNIEIKQTVITDNYINMVTMAHSSHTAPDLVNISGNSGGFDLGMFVESGMIRPLNEFIEKAGPELEQNTEISKHLYEGMNTLDGNIYWIPTCCRSGNRIQYNKTLVEEAGVTEFPKTLSGFVDLAKKITENGKGKYYGFAATSSGPAGRLLIPVAEKCGVNHYGYDYVNGKFDFSGFKPIVEEMSRLFTDGSVLPGSPTQGVDAMRAQFAQGTVGLWANASQEAGVFTDQFPVKDFEWCVTEIPTLDGEVHGAQSAMPQKGLMMMSDTDCPEAAWKVIEFFASEEYLKGYLEHGYALPFSDHMSEIVDVEKAGRIADFGKKPYESIYPCAPSVAVEGEDSDTVLWSAVMGERDIDKAIEDLNTRYNAALENDIKMGKVKRLIIKDFDPLHPDKGTLEYLDN